MLVYASISGGSRKSTYSGPKGSIRGATFARHLDDGQKYLFHRMTTLSATRVKSLEDTPTLKNAFQILTTEEKSFTVYVETPEEKEAWLHDFSSLTESSGTLSFSFFSHLLSLLVIFLSSLLILF